MPCPRPNGSSAHPIKLFSLNGLCLIFQIIAFITLFCGTFGENAIRTESTIVLTSIDTKRYTTSEYLDYYNEDSASVNSSYIAPEVVMDFEPEELILSHDQASPQGRRKPVKDGFVWEQKMELLNLHNTYRSNITPPAADMSFMEWDENLAQIAQIWANGCQFRHGFPAISYSTAMGQNLYMGWDPTGVRALLLWYEEYHEFNLKTLGCVPGKQCGHYTQMAWAESSVLGCGMKRCGIKKFFVVCHYSPPGNIIGSPPYVVGKPCSQCSLQHGGFCTNNLCVTKEQCRRNAGECSPECVLECHNCGILNISTCKCNCRDGWDSLDCSRSCTDAHDRCGENPGWPTITSCSMNQHSVGDIYCRKMCGKCRGLENSVNTCCNGAECNDGYVIDMKRNRCKCKLLCPGPECHIDNGSYLNGPTSIICSVLVSTIWMKYYLL